MQRGRRPLTVLLALAALAGLVGAVMLALDDGRDDRIRAVSAQEPIAADQGGANADRERGGMGRVLGLSGQGHPTVWVKAGAAVELRAAPGGELVKRVGRRTEFGSPTVLSVVERRGEWAGVSTHHQDNGELAWVRLDPAALRAGFTRYSVEVDLSEFTAVLLRDGKAIRSFGVTIGAPGAETPTGRFAVTDTFAGDDLNQAAYGCCALALSARQQKQLSGWLGGDRIAIHGTNDPVGAAASHGCVRASNADARTLLDRVPLGSPVTITQ